MTGAGTRRGVPRRIEMNILVGRETSHSLRIRSTQNRTLPITGFQFHPERIFRRDPRYLRAIVDALERR